IRFFHVTGVQTCALPIFDFLPSSLSGFLSPSAILGRLVPDLFQFLADPLRHVVLRLGLLVTRCSLFSGRLGFRGFGRSGLGGLVSLGLNGFVSHCSTSIRCATWARERHPPGAPFTESRYQAAAIFLNSSRSISPW